MYQEVLLQGRAGVVMRALSILDTALWDLNARSAKLPLHKYLGASEANGVAAYASGGYYLEGKTPDDLADEMAGRVSQGFKAVRVLRAFYEDSGEDAFLMQYRLADDTGDDIEESVNRIAQFEES